MIKNMRICLIRVYYYVKYNYMKIFITGVAGFIGSHLVCKLLTEDHQIYGIDNMNDYYDPKIKNRNLEIIREHNKSLNFIFSKEFYISRQHRRIFLIANPSQTINKSISKTFWICHRINLYFKISRP